MQIFGIGPLELLFILIIMILVLGPKGMLRAARELGKWIRKIVRSPIWSEIVGTSQEIRAIPTKLIREAGIEQEIEELRQSTRIPTKKGFLNSDLDPTPKEGSRKGKNQREKKTITLEKRYIKERLRRNIKKGAEAQNAGLSSDKKPNSF